jgi:hypothetical protein
MTFVKIIRPNEQFQITIIKKGENQINVDYLNNLISHIAVVKQCAKLVPDLVSLEKFNYKARSITIFSEAMNE